MVRDLDALRGAYREAQELIEQLQDFYRSRPALRAQVDFSLRDDATANSKLDQNTAFGTAGQKVIRLSPSIDYVMSSRINVKLYFEQNKVIPKIATSAPITTTRAGIQIRVSLAQ